MSSRSSLVALVLACSVVCAQAEPFHHPYGEWREYNRDWLAACPDRIVEDAADYYGYSCFASTSSAELNSANLPVYKLTLIRNRLDGMVDVAVTVAPDTSAVDQTRPMTLGFAKGETFTFDFREDLETRHDTVNQFFIKDEALRQAVLDEMEDGEAVTLGLALEGDLRAKSVRLSLNGVMGSLDFMAAYARRVDQY